MYSVTAMTLITRVNVLRKRWKATTFTIHGQENSGRFPGDHVLQYSKQSTDVITTD
jgi:hypothetical protein